MSSGANSFRVLNYTGALTGSDANLSVQNAASYRNPTFSTATANQVNLSIESQALTWSGTTGAWDVNTSSNWNGGAEKFYQGDAVTFDDSGATKTVTIAGTVLPTSVTFNNSTGNDYTVNGVIGGATGLAKNGTGMLTLTGANSYTGMTTVGAGTLKVSGPLRSTSALVVSGILDVAATNVFTSGHSVAMNAPITINAGGTVINSNNSVNRIGNINLNGAR
jgi:autotransporter-associated beta strand protein